MTNRTMKLGLTAWKHGYHVASWRWPGTPRDAMWNINAFVNAAVEAERGLFDFVFMADVLSAELIENDARYPVTAHGITRLDPMQVLAAMAMATRRVGLIATINTTYNQPFTTARAIATLDIISGGRAGWNIVNGHNIDEAQNFGLPAPPSTAERYARAREFVDVVRGLWDSWEDDAFPVDQGSGVYVDRSKMHILAHEGPHFSVRGPLNLPRPPQGHPVLVTAGTSPDGQDLAARYADAVYTANPNLGQSRKYYGEIKNRLPAYGRAGKDIAILPGLMTYVGDTETEAQAEVAAVKALVRPDLAMALLEDDFGDLSAYDVDRPIPEDAPCFDPAWGEAAHRRAKFHRSMEFLARAQAERMTIRQMAEAVAFGDAEKLVLVGTHKTIADRMEQWFEEGAADGFNIQAVYAPGNVTAFINKVVPELQRRGLFRSRYEGDTLRDHFGIARPDHARPVRAAAE